jgi:hypothetical protein
MRRWAAALVVAALAGAGAGHAALVDRVVVRFDAPETGGVRRSQFIFERELAFEARLEALADKERSDRSRPYFDRHVRAALERHVAEEVLAHLAMDPEPTAAELDARFNAARLALESRALGRAALDVAAVAEGIEVFEIDRLIRREARASLYLDRMVAPMLEPSDAELRELYRSGTSPFHGRPFDEVRGLLRQAYIGERLDSALTAFFQNTRSRVHLTFVR